MNGESLIIDSYQNEIVEAIKQFRIILIRGQSGCGKSTKVPEYIVENCFQTSNEQVYVLQNQTLAVRALGDFMSEKLQGKINVGHYYKGDCSKIKNPHILYVILSWFEKRMDNDGEINSNFIIMDDIHNISFQANIVLYKMINYLSRNINRRLILMSSYLDVKLFKKFFKYYECKLIDIQPVYSNIEIMYYQRNEDEIIKQIRELVMMICQKDNNDKNDHILILVPGIKNLKNISEDIKNLQECKVIDNCIVMESVSISLPIERIKVLQMTDVRKIIIANRNMRNGIKIPGLKYLIDYSDYSKQSNFSRIINSENIKGLLEHSNKMAKCYRFFENPFLLIFPEFIKHEIDRNIHDQYFNLNVTLLIETLMKRRYFIGKFYADLDNYFEKSIDIGEDDSNIWDGFSIEILKRILSFIYPNVQFLSYKSIMRLLKEKISDYLEERRTMDSEYKLTGKKINDCMRLTWLLLVNKIEDVYQFPYMQKPLIRDINLAVKRLMNLSLIQTVGKNLKFTPTAHHIKTFRITVSKAKLIFNAYVVKFPNQINLFEEICSICELSRNKLDFSVFNESLDDDGDIFRYYNVWKIWLKDSENAICQKNEFKYLKEEIRRTMNYFYNRKYISRNSCFVRNDQFGWRTWIKWLVLSAYVHEIAVKIGTDDEDGCDIFHALSDDVDTKIDAKSCINFNDLQIILFMEMQIYSDDNKYPYRLIDVTRISLEELREFDPKIFQIDETFWCETLAKVESFLHKP